MFEINLRSSKFYLKEKQQFIGSLQNNTVNGAPLVTINGVISTCNHMFVRAIRDKLPEYVFENFEIARVKQG